MKFEQFSSRHSAIKSRIEFLQRHKLAFAIATFIVGSIPGIVLYSHLDQRLSILEEDYRQTHDRTYNLDLCEVGKRQNILPEETNCPTFVDSFFRIHHQIP